MERPMTRHDFFFLLLVATYGPEKGLRYWEQEHGNVYRNLDAMAGKDNS